MDQETEMLKLNNELIYVDSVIKALMKLKKRKGYKDCLEDTVNLLDKLRDRKKHLRKAIEELTSEIVAVASVCGNLDFAALEE